MDSALGDGNIGTSARYEKSSANICINRDILRKRRMIKGAYCPPYCSTYMANCTIICKVLQGENDLTLMTIAAAKFRWIGTEASLLEGDVSLIFVMQTT